MCLYFYFLFVFPNKNAQSSIFIIINNKDFKLVDFTAILLKFVPLATRIMRHILGQFFFFFT